jgi:hypothetical protein
MELILLQVINYAEKKCLHFDKSPVLLARHNLSVMEPILHTIASYVQRQRCKKLQRHDYIA